MSLEWVRERLSFVLIAALVALLVLLGVMQHRWIGALSRAQSERLRADMERAGQRFGSELERELGHVFFAFLLEPAADVQTREGRYVERLRRWRSGTRHTELVLGLALALRVPSDPASYEVLDEQSGRFSEAPWPAPLDELRAHLERGGFGPRAGGTDFVLEEPLALLVPSLGEGPQDADERPDGARRRSWHVEGVAVVLLSRAYLTEQLLPELAEAHFGPPDQADFTVSVVQRGRPGVLYASDPSAALGEPRPDDLRLPLSGPRRSGLRMLHPHGPPPGHAPDRTERGGFRRDGPGPPPPWELVLRHRSGSLEAAVAEYRHRNLAHSVGVLVLIGLTAALLVLGDRRARRLARQQLEFVAGVTHELHTPLTAIRSAGQNLKDGIVTEPEHVRRYGGLIEREGGRLTELIGQVLEFAGIQSGSRAYASEPVSMAPLVRQAVRDLALVLEQAGLEAELRVPEDLPELRGDEPALRRALENLLANAAKFAAPGGVVTIAAERRGDALELRVEDRGPGIPADERERVFEPFFRGQAAQSGRVPGNGLGLSLVRHVVEAHGGCVHVEPRDGGGTSVVMLLPLPRPA